jgi:hypothetical protein
MAAMKEIKEMIAELKAMMVAETAARKETNDKFEARLTALEKKAAKASKEVPAKKTKASKSEDEGEVEEKKEKVKREVKPSAKSDAWRALCDAVRAVHKKDAMKIAKILKDGGNLEPTEEDIKTAASQLPEKEGGTSEGEKPAKSGSESEGSEGAAKKRGRPKKVVAE